MARFACNYQRMMQKTLGSSSLHVLFYLVLLIKNINAISSVQSYSESVEYGTPLTVYYRNSYQYNGNNNNNINQRQEMPPRVNYSATIRQQQQEGDRFSQMNSELNQGQSHIPRQRRIQSNAIGHFHESTITDRNSNKCRTWVPIETVNKYKLAHTIQVDQNNQQALILICCAGYAPYLWRGTTRCRPVCENCANGICIAPGECQCYEEYVKNDNGDCVFTCPLGCLNGRCFLDGSCQCDAGYKLDETRKYCRPICSTGCGTTPRHNCTEPEVCSCAKGYQLTDEGCQPICQPDCGYGGVCRENNECDCGIGYTLKDGFCQSDCYQKCDNGVCVSRNRCICKPGYTYHERSTQCVPF